jgi:hypothetical protein
MHFTTGIMANTACAISTQLRRAHLLKTRASSIFGGSSYDGSSLKCCGGSFMCFVGSSDLVPNAGLLGLKLSVQRALSRKEIIPLELLRVQKSLVSCGPVVSRSSRIGEEPVRG